MEKRERVTTTGGKDRGEVRSEIRKVTGMVTGVPTMDCLKKRYGVFGGWGMTTGKVEILLVVSGLDMDRTV